MIAALDLLTGQPNGLGKNNPGAARKLIAAVLRRQPRSHMTVMLDLRCGSLVGPLLRSTTAVRSITVLAVLLIATKAYRIGNMVGTLRRRRGAVRSTIKAASKMSHLTAKLASAIGGRAGHSPRRCGAVPTRSVVASKGPSNKALHSMIATRVTALGKQAGLNLRRGGVARDSTEVAPKPFHLRKGAIHLVYIMVWLPLARTVCRTQRSISLPTVRILADKHTVECKENVIFANHVPQQHNVAMTAPEFPTTAAQVSATGAWLGHQAKRFGVAAIIIRGVHERVCRAV